MEDLVKFVDSDGKTGNEEPKEGEEPTPEEEGAEDGAEAEAEEFVESEATDESKEATEPTKDELWNGTSTREFSSQKISYMDKN